MFIALIESFSALTASAQEYVVGGLYGNSDTRRSDIEYRRSKDFEWGGIRCGMSLEAFKSKFPTAVSDDSVFNVVRVHGVVAYRVAAVSRRFPNNTIAFGNTVRCSFWDNTLFWYEVTSKETHREVWSALRHEIGPFTTWKYESKRAQRFYWRIEDSPLLFSVLSPTFSADEKTEVFVCANDELMEKYRGMLIDARLTR